MTNSNNLTPADYEAWKAAQQDQTKPKKKKRIFMWFFLAVQFLFLIAIISAISSSGDASAAACAGQVNEFFTQEDCEAATGVGTGIGVFMIVVAWALVDFLLAVTYFVRVAASRR